MIVPPHPHPALCCQRGQNHQTLLWPPGSCRSGVKPCQSRGKQSPGVPSHPRMCPGMIQPLGNEFQQDSLHHLPRVSSQDPSQVLFRSLSCPFPPSPSSLSPPVPVPFFSPSPSCLSPVPVAFFPVPAFLCPFVFCSPCILHPGA